MAQQVRAHRRRSATYPTVEAMDPPLIPWLVRTLPLVVGIGFLWGLLEGTFFFIVPDVFLTLLVPWSVRAALLAWAGFYGFYFQRMGW